MYIVFESTNLCNANCIFCPRGLMTRPTGVMKDELFYKIIKEGKEMGIRYFYPNMMGEFFLHPRVYEWLDYMQKEGVRPVIFSNAELIDVEKLIKYKNIHYFNCSVNAATKKTYDKIMRRPNFDKVVKNTKDLIEKAPFKVQVSLVVIKENYHEIELFKEIWAKNALVRDCINWAGSIKPYIEYEGIKKRCRRVSASIPILWDGRVCLCCEDYDGKVIFGDANKEHLWDIYKRREPIRKRHRMFDYNMVLCKACNFNTVNKRLYGKT